MCGILGIWSKGGRVSREDLCRARDTLAHRGPDDTGALIWDEMGVGLAHRRLAIIDLSPLGRQPLSTRDGQLAITFNGEIYNFQELRTELEGLGHAFTSHSDTEVIL